MTAPLPCRICRLEQTGERTLLSWAGEDEQGSAFGLLDGGRGLASAVIALLAAYAFAAMVGGGEVIDPVREAAAVKKLVYSYGGYCLFAAMCVWLFVPDPKSVTASSTDSPDVDEQQTGKPSVLRRLVLVLRSPAIWLQAVVIIAAYSAFKMIDNYGIYAEDAYGLTREASAARLLRTSALFVSVPRWVLAGSPTSALACGPPFRSALAC